VSKVDFDLIDKNVREERERSEREERESVRKRGREDAKLY